MKLFLVTLRYLDNDETEDVVAALSVWAAVGIMLDAMDAETAASVAAVDAQWIGYEASILRGKTGGPKK